MKATKKSYRLQHQLMKMLVMRIEKLGESYPQSSEYLELSVEMLKNTADNYLAAVKEYAGDEVEAANE